MNSVFLVSINAMETIVVIVFYELHILCFVFYLLAAQDQKLGGGGRDNLILGGLCSQF